MSWSQENHTITFYCDTGECGANESINVDAYRTHVNASQSDYVIAESHIRDWIALKRVGHDWTHHCPKCSEQAEREHESYQQQEAVRERIKARNA